MKTVSAPSMFQKMMILQSSECIVLYLIYVPTTSKHTCLSKGDLVAKGRSQCHHQYIRYDESNAFISSTQVRMKKIMSYVARGL